MRYKKMFLSLLLVTSIEAFDNKREGFFMSLGLGVHNTSYEVDDTPNSKSGFATSQKIGYGLSEQFSLYISRDDAWYTDGDNYVYCLTGVGARYFFTPRTNAMYILGSFGVSYLTNTSKESRVQGRGGVLGVGCEIYKHLSVELDVISSNIEDSKNSEVDPVSFRFMVSYDLY